MSITDKGVNVNRAMCWPATLCALCMGLTACSRTPDASKNVTGRWTGTFKVVIDQSNGQTQHQEGRLTVQFNRDGRHWTGLMRDYRNKECASFAPLYDVKVQDSAIRFANQPSSNSPHYQGALSNDGKGISGTLILGNLRIPLNLERIAGVAASCTAQRLVVWSGGKSLVMGEFGLVDRGPGYFTYPSQQGGTEVWFFRDFDKLPRSERNVLREKNIKPGSAYLRTDEGFEFIRAVDPRLTNDEVAALFGIK
jgi:hypothetical protein